MKAKDIFVITVLSACAIPAHADISVSVPAGSADRQLQYYYAPIRKIVSASNMQDAGMVRDSVPFTDGKATIKTPETSENLIFGFIFEGNQGVKTYLAPGESLEVDITSFEPFTYSLSGNPLADDMNRLLTLEAPIYEKAKELSANREENAEALQKIGEEFIAVQKDFINSNPASPAVPVAIMNLSGEDLLSTFEPLQESLKGNILYPMLESSYERTKKSVEADRKQAALSSGTMEAPGFTLKDLDGKDVSLSDFRGKWVILDFWGSWCPWCIKGFPELKEAYEKYAGRLEIIGIDCNESEADWRAGVEKYELPWVQVYNPASGSVTADYGVRGYPTKAIIDPEGKVANITVGHNPEFFTVLTQLMGD